jgi:RimJ/RimL family protein N-acetyltransferase
MRLEPITEDDLWLAEAFEANAEQMKHLGGPRPKADVAASHTRRIALMAEGKAFMYKIVGDDGEPLGTIGHWAIDWKGPNVHEMGWFVRPEFQGQRVASAAGRLALEDASARGVETVYAYPSVTNEASNCICEKLGFENLGEFDNEGFNGILRCNDWRKELREPTN